MLTLLALMCVSAPLLGLLGVIVRFSIISPWITRGAQARLRTPDPSGIERICGFPCPADLVELYRSAPYVERTEFELVDERAEPPRVWMIAGFLPLSSRDVREARAACGKHGIPIATNFEKGVFVVLPSGAVVLRSPNVEGGQVPVASSASELATFVARDRVLDESES